MTDFHSNAVVEIATLIRQRDDLVAALEGLLNYTGGWDIEKPDHPIYIARAALSKVNKT